jgi:hypothetical protein
LCLFVPVAFFGSYEAVKVAFFASKNRTPPKWLKPAALFSAISFDFFVIVGEVLKIATDSMK